MCFTYYLKLSLASLLLVSIADPAGSGKGKARISESLAATICGSMKTYSRTQQVVGLLKTPQISGAAVQKSDGTVCRHVKWSACNNCPKFNYVSCKDHEEISSGKVQVRKSSRVVNGRDAYPNEFPFIVSLESRKIGFFCGGSIFNKNWLITAAHCAEYVDVYPDFTVVGGQHIHSIVEATEQKVKIKSIVIHEGRGTDLLHDMALIQVTPPFEFNSVVAHIRLLPKTYDLKVGHQVRVTGWGLLGSNYTEVADTLQTVPIRVISNAECQEAYDHDKFHNVTDSQVCALPESSTPSGSCGGDSGGPLTMDDEDGLRYLVGVVSGGRRSDCAALDSPSWFSRITYYYDWILAHAI